MHALAITRKLTLIIAAFTLLFLTLVVSLNLIGFLSDDEPTQINENMVASPLTPEQNAYPILAEHFSKIHSQDPYERAILNPLSTFDREAAKRWLSRNREKLQAIDNALALGQMESQFENLIDLPPYSYFGTYNNLLLLDAKLAINENRADRAIERIDDSLRFCSMLRDDNNSTLVAYFIGSHHCSRNLFFVLNWINNHTLSTNDLRLLALILEAQNQRHKGLSKVWTGEYIYAKNLLEWMQNYSLSERWQSFSYSIDNGHLLEQYFGDLIFLLAPRYAILKNRENNKYHDQMLKLTERASRSRLCSPQKLANENVEKSINPILPGAWMSNHWNTNTINTYEQYFERACLYQLLIDAVRIAVANKRYAQQYSESITSVQDLVPVFLNEVPLDAFQANNKSNSKPLRYVTNDGQVASIGNDYRLTSQENGDSDDQISNISSYELFANCHQEPTCIASPRVDITYTASQIEAEPSVKMIEGLTSKTD